MYIVTAVWGGTKVIARVPKKKLGYRGKNWDTKENVETYSSLPNVQNETHL